MDTKHTLAPWTYEPEQRDGAPVEKPSFFTIHAPHYFADVHVLVGEPDHQRTEADACLIAAAPEMLEALRAARDILHGVLMEPDRENSLHAEWRRSIAAIEAAIAKATGEAAP